MLDNFGNRVTRDDAGLDGASRPQRGAGDQHGLHRRAEAPLPTIVRWWPASTGTGHGRCAAEAGGNTCRPIRPCSTGPAGRASGGGSRPRWNLIRRPIALQYLPLVRPAADGHASPGLSAIQAAAGPADTQYCFLSPPAMARTSMPPRWPSIRRNRAVPEVMRENVMRDTWSVESEAANVGPLLFATCFCHELSALRLYDSRRRGACRQDRR